jgi:hypothetical protein
MDAIQKIESTRMKDLWSGSAQPERPSEAQSPHWRTGGGPVRVWWLISFASSGCQSLAMSVLAVGIELKSLEVPDAIAILKRNHSVLADFEDASSASRRWRP